ncbi:MAG: PLP-dependent aminotransferase family protein [Alphaproteobacteria bacterium]
MTHWDDYYATRATRMQASEIRELLKLLDQPDIISFAGGIPDPKLFPTEAIAKACQDILGNQSRAMTALQYAVSEGYLPLREWLSTYMGKLGVTCTADNILITNGSQQALDFLGKLFISPKDTVLVAWPTYLGALQAFNAYEPTYDHLPGPGSNRTPESYRVAGKPKPKFGYVMPEFQNPTGTSLTKAERIALLDAADAMDLPLIEDTAYEHLRYDGIRAPALLALASERAGGIDKAKVIYCGTFSKSIVPAMRIGWIVAPKDVIKKLVLVKQASDLHVSPFNQMILHDVASTMMEKHVDRILAVYKERRDAMLKALDTHMPKGVSWTKPEGGMFVWMTLPEAIDGAELLRRAIDEIRVAFVPGSAFFADRSGRNTIRLSFSLNDPPMIEEGMKRLGGLLRKLQGQ